MVAYYSDQLTMLSIKTQVPVEKAGKHKKAQKEQAKRTHGAE
jgi:hypothetical protein